MKILMFGRGVIASQYAWALEKGETRWSFMSDQARQLSMVHQLIWRF